MKHFTTLLLTLVFLFSKAQTDSMFIHLDKSKVTSGILLPHFADSTLELQSLNGSNDTTALDRMEWLTVNREMKRYQFSGADFPGYAELKDKSDSRV